MSPPLVWTDLVNGFTSDVDPINDLAHKVVELETNQLNTNPFALKLADETLVGPSTVLQDDNELFVSLPANTTYTYHAHIIQNTNAAAGFKLDHTMPSGSTWYPGTFQCQVGPQVGIMTTSALAGVNGNSADAYVEFWTTIKTGGTAGLMVVKWAQSTGHASNAIVRAGSYIEFVRRG